MWQNLIFSGFAIWKSLTKLKRIVLEIKGMECYRLLYALQRKWKQAQLFKYQLYFAIIAEMILLTMLRGDKVKYFAGYLFSQLG